MDRIQETPETNVCDEDRCTLVCLVVAHVDQMEVESQSCDGEPARAVLWSAFWMIA